MENHRGGRRPGAGRPSKDLVPCCMRLRREDLQLIRQTAQEVGISQAEVVHELIEAYQKACEN